MTRVEPATFFELLLADSEFCRLLGRVLLRAGQLEAEISRYCTARGRTVNEKAPLGALVSLLEDDGALTENGAIHFRQLALKRNYLAHNLYRLLLEDSPEALLPTEVVAADVETYSERLAEFDDDLSFFVGLTRKADPASAHLL